MVVVAANLVHFLADCADHRTNLAHHLDRGRTLRPREDVGRLGRKPEQRGTIEAHRDDLRVLRFDCIRDGLSLARRATDVLQAVAQEDDQRRVTIIALVHQELRLR